MKFRIDRASRWGIYTEPEAPAPPVPGPPLPAATFEGWTVYRIPRGDPHRNPHSSYTPIWTIEVEDFDALLALAVLAPSGVILRLPDAEDDRQRSSEYEISPLERELPLITIYDGYIE